MMSKLTIIVDEIVLRKARRLAREQGTSLNAILREYLEACAGLHTARGPAIDDLLRLSRSAKARRGQAHWSRDELYYA